MQLRDLPLPTPVQPCCGQHKCKYGEHTWSRSTIRACQAGDDNFNPASFVEKDHHNKGSPNDRFRYDSRSSAQLGYLYPQFNGGHVPMPLPVSH